MEIEDTGMRLAKATAYDAEDLVSNMRQADRAEILLMSGSSVEDAVHWTIEQSEYAVAARDKKTLDLLCLYGTAELSKLGGVGAIWMLGTDALKSHPKGMVRRTRRVVKSLLENRYERLTNVVWDGNEASKLFLSAVGFTFSEVEHTRQGVPFRQFWRDRTDV